MHVFALCLETKDPQRNAWASCDTCESYIDFSFISPRSILATQHSTPMIRIGNDRSPEAMGMHCLLLKALEACRHSNVHIYIYTTIYYAMLYMCVLCIWHVCIKMHMHSHTWEAVERKPALVFWLARGRVKLKLHLIHMAWLKHETPQHQQLLSGHNFPIIKWAFLG